MGKSHFAQQYANRLDLVDRAISWGELPKLFTPLHFLTWAHQYKVDVPDAFINFTFDRGEPIKYWHDLCAEIEAELEATRTVLEAQREALQSFEDERELVEQRSFDEWLAVQDEIDRLKIVHAEQEASLQEELVGARTRIADLEQQVMAPRIAEKPLSTAERNSLLTIAIAAAVDGHGYDPKSPKNSAPQEIADAATCLGLKTTDETVLKYLKAATKLRGFVYPDMVPRKPKSGKRKPKSV